MKRHIKLLTITGIVIISLLSFSTTALAIDLPDETPEVESIWAYRNILETADMLVIVYENTPYATTPNMTYSEAFIWKIYDTDGSTELGYALTSDYHDLGYGYNVISFYFSADDAVTWGEYYYIRLKGLGAAFESPPTYTFQMAAGDYSALTDQDEVREEIAHRIMYLASWLNNEWDLDSDEKLTAEYEIGTRLSVEGQAFFRQAIYGSQAMAPTVFPLYYSGVTDEDRTWTDAYVATLEAQHTGTDLGAAITEGEVLLDADYNMMGFLIVLVLVIMLIFGHWYLGSGNRWTGLVESAPVLVIGGRMALLGLGELGLVAAICLLYISGRIWKVF